jgi:hypothetical protein
MESTVHASSSDDSKANTTVSPAPDVVSVTAKVVQGEAGEEKWPQPVVAEHKTVTSASPLQTPDTVRSEKRAPVKSIKRQSK